MLEATQIESFNFWLPIGKSESIISPDGQKLRKIYGIASTADVDLQGEVVDQKGIDTAYFLKHGYFNNDHKNGFENKVGYPTVARQTKDGLYVEGVLFNDNKVADDIWNMMHSVKQTPGAKRQVGFSVQGKVKRRMGKQILECWVQDIAITPAPINTKTWADVAKSLAAQEWVDEEEIKALTAGYATSNQTGGAALRPESLGRPIHNLTYGQKKDGSRVVRKSALVKFIQLNKGYSRSTAELMADVIFLQSQLGAGNVADYTG